MKFPKGSIQEPAKLRWEVGDREVRFTVAYDGDKFFSFELNEENMMDLILAWLQEVPPPPPLQENIHNAV